MTSSLSHLAMSGLGLGLDGLPMAPRTSSGMFIVMARRKWAYMAPQTYNTMFVVMN